MTTSVEEPSVDRLVKEEGISEEIDFLAYDLEVKAREAFSQGDHRKAQEFYQQAVAHYLKNGDFGSAGSLAEEMEDYKKAVDYYTQEGWENSARKVKLKLQN